MTLLYIQSGHFQTASFSLGLRLNETICKPPRRGISDSYTTSGPLDSSPLAFLSQLFGLSPLQCSSQDWVLDVGTNPSLCQEKYWTCNIPSYFMLLHKRWNFWQDCVPASPTHLDVVFYPLCGKAVHVLFRYILVESDPYVAANLVCPWKEVTRDLPTPPSCESPSSWNFNWVLSTLHFQQFLNYCLHFSNLVLAPVALSALSSCDSIYLLIFSNLGVTVSPVLFYFCFVCLFYFSTSLFTGTIRCSGLIMYFPCHGPRVKYIFEKPHSPLVGEQNSFRNEDLDTKNSYHYWGDIASSSQWIGLGSIWMHTNSCI